MKLIGYPRCYASDKVYSIPRSCGGIYKAHQHWALFSAEGVRMPITGWMGNTPTVGDTDDWWQGPPAPDWEPSSPPQPPALAQTQENIKDAARSISDRLKEFFEFGNSASDAAKAAGYALIASVGAGLLLWYVPRKKG